MENIIIENHAKKLVFIMSLALSGVACGGTEAEYCAEHPEACLAETSEKLETATIAPIDHEAEKCAPPL